MAQADPGLRSVADFLEGILDQVREGGGQSWQELLDGLLPWAGLVVEATAEHLLPVRYLMKLLDRWLTEKDPNKLGYLACTLAVQRSVQQSLLGLLGQEPVRRRRAPTLAASKSLLPYEFTGFSLRAPHEHPFLRDVSALLEDFAVALGLRGDQKTYFAADVQARFLPNLLDLISSGPTRERFEPFRELLALGAAGLGLEHALRMHVDYQRRLYEEEPVLGREPFSLADVYVDPECTMLPWKDLEQGVDPFASCHPRQGLYEAVESLLGRADYREPIVIQGPAGCGKSSFTLRLCAALAQRGLTPLRVELKHLDTRRQLGVEESLPRALRLLDQEGEPAFLSQARSHGEEFLQLFERRVFYRGVRMCPFVLVLDGWDELPTRIDEDYRDRLQAFLNAVQEVFVTRRAVPVRAVFVGRPSDVLAGSGLLAAGTCLISVVPWDAERLGAFYQRVAAALVQRGQSETGTRWSMPERQVLARLVGLRQSGLDILGSPLLAHLCLRLLSEQDDEDAVGQLVDGLAADPSLLYRRLTDLVIAKAGKAPEADFDPGRSAMIAGADLRHLLQCTAEAMKLAGTENISRDELQIRLEVTEEGLDRRLNALEGHDRLSRLLISFFFKGGHRTLGCEFSHKSFREYLLAERIVEILKSYGRDPAAMGLDPKRPSYRDDFPLADPRHHLVRALLPTLGRRRLVAEEEDHLWHLISWEIQRGLTVELGQAEEWLQAGIPTAPCSLTQWRTIREGLADLWHYWQDAVHLRPQPRAEPNDWAPPLASALAVDLVNKSDWHGGSRLNRIDAYYGWALFRLTSLLHARLRAVRGFPETPSGVDRRSQSRANGLIVFRPAVDLPRSMLIADARIASTGYVRPRSSPFSGVQLQGVSLRQVILRHVVLSAAHMQEADLREADLRSAELVSTNLAAARLQSADLRNADLRDANLSGAQLQQAKLSGARLDAADLTEADLSEAVSHEAHFKRACLKRAVLRGAQLQEAVMVQAQLTRADLSSAALRDANLRGCELRQANLHMADLGGANLSRCSLRGADLRGASLEVADLRGADLSGADLRGSKLDGANLSGADLRGANLDKASMKDALTIRSLLDEAALFSRQQNGLADRGATIVWSKPTGD